MPSNKESLADWSIDELCTIFNLRRSVDALGVNWDVSGESMPADLPFFLKPDYIADACLELAMPWEIADALQHTAKAMAADKRLSRLAWHAYWIAFEADTPQGAMSSWPSFKEAVKAPGDLFYAVVALGALPRVRELYARRQIPQEVIAASLGDLRVKILFHRKQWGELGLSATSFNFLRRLFAGELYQLERLQFHFGPFRSRLRVYRRRRDGMVIALSEGDVTYRPDGEFYVGGRGDPSYGTWTSTFTETGDSVVAHPVIPKGKALPDPVTLKKDEWQLVLAPGDNVLQIHIPGSDPMDFDACGRSLEKARDFFETYFPENPFKAFACSSWLLDDQLEVMLPRHSNLVRFLREFYRFPSGGSTEATLRWVFGAPPDDLRKAPQDTTLRRRVIEHLLNGGSFFGGAGFILVEDLQWGSQVYRKQDLQESEVLC